LRFQASKSATNCAMRWIGHALWLWSLSSSLVQELRMRTLGRHRRSATRARLVGSNSLAHVGTRASQTSWVVRPWIFDWRGTARVFLELAGFARAPRRDSADPHRATTPSTLARTQRAGAQAPCLRAWAAPAARKSTGATTACNPLAGPPFSHWPKFGRRFAIDRKRG
jgi:hypothetical protein